MRKSLLIFFILSVALVGCQTGAPANKLNVELSDFTISLNQSTVQTNSEVTVSVTNSGTVEHDFNIMKYGVDIGGQFDDEDRTNILWEIVVQPGETKSQTFTVPDQAGTYQVVCAMPGHLQAGMLGTLDVVK